MENVRKPSSFAPWALTVAAALDLCALVFLAASSTDVVVLVVFAVCELALILCAVAAWQKHVGALIDRRIKEALERREGIV